MKSVIVGTAGHIDHGKTSLVKALTGIDADRLEEEKRRGITIDIGFAHFDLNAPDGSTIRVGFVDVPGHERFVRNMLAGVGGTDLALLVIAADEGIKPQTREHFDICRMLAIHHGITVSMYYADPDGNQMEFQVDAFDDNEEANAFMRRSFAVNPIGVEYDPDAWLARVRSGAPAGELLARQTDLPVSPVRNARAASVAATVG